MSLLKNIKDRMVLFVIGIVMTAVACFLFYYDFVGPKTVYSGNSLSYSIPIFFTGICCVLFAFDKKKKKEDDVRKEELPKQ